jgi:hypothetical protein
LDSSREQDAFAKEIEAGPAEHLPLQHLQPVDVALDGAGTVGKGKSVADGVEVAAEVAGEAREWGEGVSFDLGDPVLERSPRRAVIMTANFLTCLVIRSNSGSRSRSR